MFVYFHKYFLGYVFGILSVLKDRKGCIEYPRLMLLKQLPERYLGWFFQ